MKLKLAHTVLRSLQSFFMLKNEMHEILSPGADQEESSGLIIFPFPPGSKCPDGAHDQGCQMSDTLITAQHLELMSMKQTLPARLVFSYLHAPHCPKHLQRNDWNLNSFENIFNPPQSFKMTRVLYLPHPVGRHANSTQLSIVRDICENRHHRLGRAGCSLRKPSPLILSLM